MDIRRTLTAVAFVLLGGCTFQASCGGNKLDMKKAREFVSGMLQEQAGVAPTKVDCPADVPIEKGKTFICTVELAGVSGNVTLVQEDDAGYVTVQAVRGLLLTNKLEATIAEGIKQQGGIDAKVDCGPRVHPAVPDATFECRASDASGQAVRVGVTVTDDVGNVHWNLIGRVEQ